MLTACGIETNELLGELYYFFAVATVLTACGIETYGITITEETVVIEVATVLTACGIETFYRGLVAT